MPKTGAIESGIQKMAFDSELVGSLKVERLWHKIGTWSEYAKQIGQQLGFDDAI